MISGEKKQRHHRVTTNLDAKEESKLCISIRTRLNRTRTKGLNKVIDVGQKMAPSRYIRTPYKANTDIGQTARKELI